ncbi:MAG: hypothetical protein QXT86_10010 [Archaeoglobaceae archaeon]
MSESTQKLSKVLTETFAKLPYAIFIVEELAEELMEGLKKEDRKVRTTAFEKYNFTVDRVETLLDVSGVGTVRELILVVDKPLTVINFEVDGIPVVPSHRSLDDLVRISPKLVYLSVFTDNGEYIVHLKDIKFSERAVLVVSPATHVFVKRFFALIDVTV